MFMKIGVIALVTFTASAFANFASLPHAMEGKGEWETPTGKGTWTSVITAEKTEKGVKIKEVLTVKTKDQKDETMEITWEAAQKDSGFHEISMDGRVTGWAHCFKHTCQITSAGKDAGSRWAETLHISKKGVYRIGTDHGEKHQVAYRGVMKKK